MSDPRARAEATVRAYYDAFNRADLEGFLGLLAEDVVHDISQGPRETGREAFRAFMARMSRCDAERIEDRGVLTEPSGTRAAAEFTVHGRSLVTDPGLPEARGRGYVLPAGASFELRGGRVARISNHSNLQDWLHQVVG